MISLLGLKGFAEIFLPFPTHLGNSCCVRLRTSEVDIFALQYDFVVATTGLAEPQAFIVSSHDIIRGETNMFGFIKTVIKIKLVIVMLIALLWLAKKMHDKHHKNQLVPTR
jgi:hypothetical protein